MEVKEIRRRNVHHLVKEAGGPTAFGVMVQRDQVQVSQWVAGKSIGSNLARHIEDAIGRPVGWLDAPHWDDADEPTPAALVEIPIYSARVSAGPGADNRDAAKIGTLFFRPSSLAKKGIAQEHAHVFPVDGDSMIPRLYKGDVVMIDTTQTTIRNGKIYVLRIGDDDSLVKRLFQLPDGKIRVCSDNKSDPQYADFEVDQHDVTIIGRVRWIGSWED